MNVAAGAGPALDVLAEACGDALLDRHADQDHDRSVFTLAGPDDRAAETAALALADAAARELDLTTRPPGVHPRLGVVDVVPFVAWDQPGATAVAAARRAGGQLAERHGVPVFFYDEADPERRSLPSVRREAFGVRAPDLGPARPHPRLGAAAVGARPPLVAVNCWLDRDDLRLARAVAGEVRERDGGLPGVRALGLRLASRGITQVSMNVTDLGATGVEAACEAVRRRVEARGAAVSEVEWVGLVPAAEWGRCSQAFRAWSGLDQSRTVEARLARDPRP